MREIKSRISTAIILILFIETAVNTITSQQNTNFTQISIQTMSPPQITSLGDQTLYQGNQDEYTLWIIFDVNPSNYSIYINGIFNETYDWTNPDPTYVNISVNNITPDTYSYTIRAYDELGNSAQDIVFITILPEDLEAPHISSPEDIIYEYGTVSHMNLIWTIHEISPFFYQLYRDETLLDASVYTDRVKIVSTEVGSLAIGTYNFTLIACDDFMRYSSDTVLVTVFDTFIPEDTPDNSLWYLLLIIPGLAIVSAVTFMIIKKRKREEI